MNKVILIGRLTKDPEVSSTNSGVSLARFTLAVDRAFKSQNGEKETDFLPIIVWRQQAETCGKYLKKGSLCAVFGSVQVRSYEKDGERRYSTEIIAESVQFLDSKRSDNDFDDAPAPAPKAASGKKNAAPQLTPIDDDDLPF